MGMQCYSYQLNAILIEMQCYTYQPNAILIGTVLHLSAQSYSYGEAYLHCTPD